MTKIYFYDAFGNDENISGDDKNPFRYKGEYYDKSTGTYYLRARYYNPVIGRMLSQDSVRSATQNLPNGIKVVNPHSLNLYAYCYNNPIMYMDPSGNIAITTLILIGSIVLGGVASIYTGYKSHEETGEIDWIGSAISGISVFMISYTIGTSIYGLYTYYSDINGKTVVTDIKFSNNAIELFNRNATNTSELSPEQFAGLKYNGEVSAGRSGGTTPTLGMPNSYYKTKGGHVLIYDSQGKLIYDINSKRVKGFNININPLGEEFFKDFKLKGPVPEFIKKLFGW